MKNTFLCLIIAVFALISVRVAADIKIINKDHVDYNIELNCGNLHNNFVAYAWNSIVFTLDGNQIQGQQDQSDNMCYLKLDNGDTEDLFDMSTYVIQDGDMSRVQVY